MSSFRPKSNPRRRRVLAGVAALGIAGSLAAGFLPGSPGGVSAEAPSASACGGHFNPLLAFCGDSASVSWAGGSIGTFAMGAHSGAAWGMPTSPNNTTGLGWCVDDTHVGVPLAAPYDLGIPAQWSADDQAKAAYIISHYGLDNMAVFQKLAVLPNGEWDRFGVPQPTWMRQMSVMLALRSVLTDPAHPANLIDINTASVNTGGTLNATEEAFVVAAAQEMVADATLAYAAPGAVNMSVVLDSPYTGAGTYGVSVTVTDAAGKPLPQYPVWPSATTGVTSVTPVYWRTPVEQFMNTATAQNIATMGGAWSLDYQQTFPNASISSDAGVAHFDVVLGAAPASLTFDTEADGGIVSRWGDNLNSQGNVTISTSDKRLANATINVGILPSPVIGTTATDTVDGDHIIGVGGSISDAVAYSGLTPGQQYTLVAKIMTQAGVDTGATASTTFTPTAADGTVNVGPIVVPANLNGTFVVFEELFLGTDTTAVPVAVHQDLTDTNQTFTTQAPTVGTTATDTADGDHIIGVGGSITDTVAYTGLIPGQQYTLVAKLMTQAGVDTGITASAAFTPTAAAGTVDVGPIVVPANLAGTFVVFEDLYFGTDTTVTPIGSHHDLTDTNQTVRTGILIGTVATDNLDGDHVVGTSGSVIDTVAYSGLTPGQQYTLVAKIMTQAGVDTGITANAKFTPSNPVGSVAVGPISIPANLAGTFVVFEDLYLGTDTTVPATAVHHDLTDTNQTFTTGVPTITTKVDQVDRKPGETNFDVGTVTGVDPAFVGRIVLNVYRDLPGDAITGAAVCASAPAHTITYDIAGNGDHASPVYTVAADEVPGVVYVHQESLVAPDGTVLATDTCGAPTELTTITKKSSGGDFGGTF